MQDKVYLLLTPDVSYRPATYSHSVHFHNSDNEQYRVREHGSPLQKRNSLLWTGKQGHRELALKMTDRYNMTTLMGTFGGLLGVRVFSQSFFFTYSALLVILNTEEY